jgi:hypothetical protein
LARKSLLLLEKSGTLERSIVISERQGELPSPKRARRERTDEWAKIQQWTLWPEQTLYEEIRPLVLFHETAGERAKAIDVPQRTLARHPRMSLNVWGCEASFLRKSMGEHEKAA